MRHIWTPQHSSCRRTSVSSAVRLSPLVRLRVFLSGLSFVLGFSAVFVLLGALLLSGKMSVLSGFLYHAFSFIRYDALWRFF